MREDLGDAVLIAVGTREDTHREDCGKQVVDAVRWARDTQTRDLVLVMKSTVPPGTGQRLLRTTLAGTNIAYAANPEFLRQGTAVLDWDNPDRIVVGVEPGDDRALEAVRTMFVEVDTPMLVTDIASAEMIKYASNAFLATRISFMNEIAALCEAAGASIDDVSTGVAMDSRMGTRIHAGVGYGGSCLPRDLRTLAYLATASQVSGTLLQSVDAINRLQRLRPLEALRHRFGSNLRGARVAVLGLSFKPGTDDVTDAPSLDLIAALAEEGVAVSAFDPVAVGAVQSRLPSGTRLAGSVAEAAQGAQALVLMTEWQEFVHCDWRVMASRMLPPRFVFDGRNALDWSSMSRLGYEYMGIGRSAASRETPLGS